MKLNNILVPTDFSDRSEAALEYSSDLAAMSGGRLHIMHVDDLMDFAAIGAADGACVYDLPERHDELKANLAKVRPTAAGVDYSHHFIQGVPSAQIVSLADELPADLIVMSSHGRTGLSRLLMGSVAESVLRHAKCPVLIVKQVPQPSPNQATIEPAHSRM